MFSKSAEDPNHTIQKRLSTTISFEFQEEAFIYVLKDSSGTQTLEVPYLGVDIRTIDEFIEKNDWTRNVGILWFGIGLFEIVSTRKGSLWFILWIIMLITYYYRRTRYASLDTRSGRVLVIKDKKHDMILENIRFKKRGLLREKLFCLDESNDPKDEALKFKYLKEEGAITDEEFIDINNKLLQKNGLAAPSITE